MIDRRHSSRNAGTTDASTGFQRNPVRCDASGAWQGAHIMLQHASGDEQSLAGDNSVDTAPATVSDSGID